MDDDIQVLNMDTWKGGGGTSKYGLTFTQIIIQHINRCVLAGSKEMIKGFWQTKRDKYGNDIRSYEPDTRLEFINCVQTLKHILLPSFDDEAKKKTVILMEQINEANKRCLKAEEVWFDDLNINAKKKTYHVKGFLNQDAVFFQQFINYKVDIYRMIFEELILLGKRLNFFEEESIEEMM